MNGLRDQIAAAESQVVAVYRGNPDAVRYAMLTLLSHGHLLIEDVPGIGKTTLALALARAFDLEFRRVQMTADLLPADLIGVSVYDQNHQRFDFHEGPIFANVLLVDELNRATPKTQSALLEAMAEGAVTVDGQPRRLPDPYIVLATQNPVEQVGTFPLPESQLDRFLMRIRLGYPDADVEREMIKDQRYGERPMDRAPVMNAANVLEARQSVSQVDVHPDVAAYITEIVSATRAHPEIALGVSPRGTLALAQAARAQAWVEGRDFVSPTDVHALAIPVLAHRVLPQGTEAGEQSLLQEELFERVLDEVPAPV